MRMVLAGGLLMAAVSLSAQTPQQDVIAVVTRFFDGMRAHDAAMMSSTLHTDVQLVSTSTDAAGKAVARTQSMKAFLESVSKSTNKLDERVSSPEVRIEDNLATVWARYELYVDDKYNHCGIDAFQLVKTEAGWKIAAIADTRKASCK